MIDQQKKLRRQAILDAKRKKDIQKLRAEIREQRERTVANYAKLTGQSKIHTALPSSIEDKSRSQSVPR